MELISIFILAIGLSFDTFAVSTSTGLIINEIKFRQAIRFAIILAVFQAIMPLVGWFAGLQVKDLIKDYDHWIAFTLLSLLGLKMIYESFKKDEKSKNLNPLKTMVNISIAVATSIDALIIGVSFAFIETRIVPAIIIIGFVTFFVSMLGVLLGKKVGEHFGRRIEVFGGLILISIGIKILIEHLCY